MPDEERCGIDFSQRPDLPDCLIDRVDWRYRNFSGRGWWPLLEEMHTRLREIDPDYRLCQVKEKLALLRVYADFTRYALPARDEHGLPLYDSRAEKIKSVIAECEERSGTICEKCGQPWRLRAKHDAHWWAKQLRLLRTLCDRCRDEEMAARGPSSLEG